MPAKGSNRAGAFALELEGSVVGYLHSYEGGNIYAEVITEPPGPDGIQKKHLGQPQYEDVRVQFGLSMGKELYEWIRSLLDKQVVTKNGSILTLDVNGKIIEEIQFVDALISEITFPAADGSSKEPAYLTVQITPEHTRRKAGSGQTPPLPTRKAIKKWLPSNFRFELGNLPCKRVASIESFSILQQVNRATVGEWRDFERQPGHLEIPNLRVTLSAADAPDWYAWFDEFVVMGNNTDDRELSGSLTWLGPDLKTELATLNLSHVGIFRLAPDQQASGSEAIRRVIADLYCEQMAIEFKQ